MVKLRRLFDELRAHRGLFFLAAIVASSVVYLACGGDSHTFQDDQDTGEPGVDSTTKDVSDDVPSSNG